VTTAQTDATSDPVAERPASRPWTPSYSVTHQSANENPVAEEVDEPEEPVPTSALETPATQDRPPSRPWTPSYSVTNQAPAEQAAEHADEPEVAETSEDDAAPQTLATPAEGERPPSRPWTPSYSVTSQRPDQLAAEPKIDESQGTPEVQADALPEARSLVTPADDERPASRPWTPSYSVTTQPSAEEPVEPDAQPEEPASQGPALQEALATPVDSEARPSRPWTPSYSVTNQQPEEHAPQTETQETLDEPQADGSVEETPAAHALGAPSDGERPPSRPWTPSYSVTTQPSAEEVEEPVAQPDEREEATQQALATPADAEAPPSRPWTPSYSVTNQQGPDAAAVAEQTNEPGSDSAAPSAPLLHISTEEPTTANEAAAQGGDVAQAPLTPQIQINDDFAVSGVMHLRYTTTH
jgi:hypothetical protein